MHKVTITPTEADPTAEELAEELAEDLAEDLEKVTRELAPEHLLRQTDAQFRRSAADLILAIARSIAPRQVARLAFGYSPSQADAQADHDRHPLAGIDVSDFAEEFKLAIDAGIAKVEHGRELLDQERLHRFVRYAIKSAIFDVCSLAYVEGKIEHKHERIELLEGGSCDSCGCDLFGPTTEDALCAACAEELEQ